jgi:hypothetical protein
MNNCETCRWWVPELPSHNMHHRQETPTWGDCYVKPPVLVTEQTLTDRDMKGNSTYSQSVKSSRPKVYISDFCSKFEVSDE